MDMLGLNRQHERDTPLHEMSFFMMPKQSESKKSALKLLGTQANDDAVEDNRETPDTSDSGTCGPAAEAWQFLDPR